MCTEEVREAQLALIKRLLHGKPKSLRQLSTRLSIHTGIVVIRLTELERRGDVLVITSVPTNDRTHTTNRLYAAK